MNDILKKALFFGALGCILGLTIGVVFWIIGNPGNLTDQESVNMLIKYLIVSGLYGAVAMGASAVYDIEEWSIARATTVHFIVTLIGFYVLGFVEGWLVFGDVIFYIMSAAFVVIYFIIWFVQYLSFRRMVNEMNLNLAKMRAQEKEQTKE